MALDTWQIGLRDFLSNTEVNVRKLRCHLHSPPLRHYTYFALFLHCSVHSKESKNKVLSCQCGSGGSEEPWQGGMSEWMTSYSLQLLQKTFKKQRLVCFVLSGQAEKLFLPY